MYIYTYSYIYMRGIPYKERMCVIYILLYTLLGASVLTCIYACVYISQVLCNVG